MSRWPAGANRDRRGRTPGFGEGGPGQFEEGLIVARERVRGEGLKGCFGLALPPAQDQPSQRESGTKQSTGKMFCIIPIIALRAPAGDAQLCRGATLGAWRGIRSNTAAEVARLARTQNYARPIVIGLLVVARAAASYVDRGAVVEGTGAVPDLAQHAVLRDGAGRAATLLAFAVLWTAPCARPQIRRDVGWANISLRAHLDAGPAAARLPDCGGVDRYVDRGALRRIPRAAGGGERLARRGIRQPLSFYLFDLPFYSLVRGYVLALVIFSILVYWVAARGWQLRYRFPELRERGELDPAFSGSRADWNRASCAAPRVVLLLALAVRFFLARYEMVYNDHGTFLVGVDYVDQNFGLPLQWLVISLPGGGGVRLAGRWKLAAVDGARAGDSLRGAARGVARCTSGPTRFRSSGPTSRRTSMRRAARTGWSSA